MIRNLIQFVVSLVSTVLSLSYTKTYYFEECNTYYTGEMITQQMNNVTLRSCRRVCDLYQDCHAFTMTWTHSGHSGTCQILYGNVNEHQTQNKTDTSYFWSCPGKMVAKPETRQCYELIRTRKRFDDAMAYCAQMYRGAHLVDIQTREEDEFIDTLLSKGDRKVFVAGRRTNPDDTYEFFWMTTSELVTSTNWRPGRPSADDHRNCIVKIEGHNWKWNNLNCARKRLFICEL